MPTQFIQSAAANLQSNIESVGGELKLYTDKLVFAAHRFNVQRDTTEISVASIAQVEKAWTRFLGLIPLFPNALAVETHEGRRYVFTLNNRNSWKHLIEQCTKG